MRTTIAFAFAASALVSLSGCAFEGAGGSEAVADAPAALAESTSSNASALDTTSVEAAVNGARSGTAPTCPSSLVGSYVDPNARIRQLVSLELAADGTYAARVNVSDIALCFELPCTQPETGRWVARPVGKAFALALQPDEGERRVYKVRRDPETGALLILGTKGVEQILVPAEVAVPGAVAVPAEVETESAQ